MMAICAVVAATVNLTVDSASSKKEDTMKVTEFSLMLKATKEGEIGIFATHDIPAGAQVFSKIYNLRKLHSSAVPQELRKLCVEVSDEECLCPERFDRMEIAWYVRHSKNPNIKRVEPKGCEALHDIKAGEEIVMNFEEFNEPDHLRKGY